MAALLTSVLDVSDKISEYIQAARDMGIAVLPPDVNESYDELFGCGRAISASVWQPSRVWDARL